MLLTPPHPQRHNPGTLHPPTLRAPPYTHARCNQRIPAVSDATNACHQRIPTTYPYHISLQYGIHPLPMQPTYTCNVCLQRIPATYPCDISLRHIPNTYPHNISLTHIPIIYLQNQPHHMRLWTFLVTYGKLWLVLVNHGESW